MAKRTVCGHLLSTKEINATALNDILDNSLAVIKTIILIMN